MITLNKILYPTDFSSAAAEAFDTAQRLARDSEAFLLIVHVVEPTQIPTPPGAVVPPNAMSNVDFPLNAEQAMERAGEELRKIVPNDASVRFEHRLLRGIPSSKIASLAEEEKPDLIVMGTHGRTGLERLLMGSVAEAVVRRANCPVLTLRQSAALFQGADEDTGTRNHP